MQQIQKCGAVLQREGSELGLSFQFSVFGFQQMQISHSSAALPSHANGGVRA